MRSLALLAALLSSATPALETAVDLYQTGEFDRARQALAPLVDDPDLAQPQRARALLYLAASLHGAQNPAAAKQQLRRLAKEFPDFRFSRTEFHPKFVALADEARAEVERETQAAAPKQPPPADQPPADPPPAGKVAPGEPPPTVTEPGERAVRARLGALYFGEPVNMRFCLGASAGVSLYGVDLGARLLLGDAIGFGVEAAYRFRDGNLLQPRLAVRFTGLPGDGAWGGGAAAGLQVAVTRYLWVAGEAGVEYLAVGGGGRLSVPLGISVGALL